MRMDRGKGFSYVEVLVASLLLAVALVPALEALRTAGQSIPHLESGASENFHLLAKLEEVLSKPYHELDQQALAAGGISTPTVYSDASGADRRRIVYLSRYDGDNADTDGDGLTGGDPGLVIVRVELEGTAQRLESLVSRGNL